MVASKAFQQVLVLLCCYTYSFGQVPFDCNGRGYRVLSAQGGTYLQEIQQNDANQTITFLNLHFYQNYDINAIAYHPTQNVIYGILQTPPYRLCRIDAAFNLEILQTLPLPTDLVFVSGDISPDEQHLVLFGFGDTNTENIIALVDVEGGGFDTQILPLKTTNPTQPYIYCADIAFHPTNDKLFGFDFKNGRLVTLDIANRLIDNDAYPLSSTVVGNVPSIFFTDKGALFGIGANIQEETENRGYYHFDVVTGQPTLLEELEIEKNQDACSCPYRIKVLNDVRQRKNVPCTELAFELTLINRTDLEQFDLVLRDTFPQDVIIKNISPLPFDGIIEQGIGSNILTIKELDLPIGTFTFEVILDVEEDAAFGDYENQAVLSGIQLEDVPLNTVHSDDPKTAVPDDATQFSIDALSDPFSGKFFGICEGGSVTLHTGIYGANSYAWSSGEVAESIRVSKEGNYQVTITTDCAEVIGTATVTLDEIGLELGHDQIFETGETILIAPNYTSLSPIKSFQWQMSSSQDIVCPSCEIFSIEALVSTEVDLMMENLSGCQTEDRLFIEVADVEIYAPNVFKPNEGYLNDYFYFQGNLAFDIAQFQIFDRWGSLIFHKKYTSANQAQEGWDGTQNGKACPTGVYLWTAVIAFKNGEEKTISGDVTLIR